MFLNIHTLSCGEQPSKNLLIEGENLHVLAVLPAETIDFVLTDPPYNTGRRFRYNDRWKQPSQDRTEGVYVTEQEVGRHACWLNFIAARLQAMKKLLKPSGVLAICIGKEELFRLGILMDDLFGEHNQLGIINWQKRYSPANDAKHLADTTDYVLIYAKDRSVHQHENGLFQERQTLWGLDDPCLDPDRLKIGDVPMLPFPLSWYQSPFEIGSQSWRHEQSGHNQDATKLLNAIMGGGNANATPKPLKLIEKIIQLWCPPDGVVLDAFAGSGTTGHAVLDLNSTVGSKRSFLLIEQGNITTGDMFARTLTAERLQRVLTGEWAIGLRPPLPGGFLFQCFEKGREHQVLSEMEVA